MHLSLWTRGAERDLMKKNMLGKEIVYLILYGALGFSLYFLSCVRLEEGIDMWIYYFGFVFLFSTLYEAIFYQKYKVIFASLVFPFLAVFNERTASPFVLSNALVSTVASIAGLVIGYAIRSLANACFGWKK